MPTFACPLLNPPHCQCTKCSFSSAPSQAWLPACIHPHRSRDGLAAALGPDFEFIEEADLAQATRSCERMYGISVMHATLWRRVA